ncbi:MAG TPA: hypothetical protein PL110_06450 [Candidatus Eremiobacteraeota bacterium]|nr:hypothetical protein [Candidatus Eremiobacteraeota bacterium]
MSINYQFSPVIFSFKNKMRRELKGNQYKIMDTIADEVFLFEDTRLTLTKELSTRYLAGKTGICQPNVCSVINKLEKKKFIRSIKSHIKGEGSLITIILDSNSISENDKLDSTLISNQVKSDSTLLSNQESISKNPDQEGADSDSSINQIQENSKEVLKNNNTSNSSYESKSNVSAENLPGRAVATREVTALGDILPAVLSVPQVTAPLGKVTGQVLSGKNSTVSPSALTTGKKVLSEKGLDCEIVVSRILADMQKYNVKCKDRYFITACNNERAVVGALPPSHPAHSETKNVIRRASIVDKVRCWENEKIQEVDYINFAGQVKTQFPEVFNTLWAEVESSFKGQKFVFDIQKYQKFYEMYMACV